jgi:hypothetical protein
MISVVTIVEGHGEVAALPVLLRRLHVWLTPKIEAEIPSPIRIHRNRFLNHDDEFRRVLSLAAAKSGDGGRILIILDADDECPATLGSQILERARQHAPHRRISVVLANREYEAWFIAAARSLDGQRGFTWRAGDEVVDAEGPRDAKGWIKARMTSGVYGEVTDQPAFSARIDLQQAYDGSRSFRKLCSEWRRAVQ